MPTPASRPPSRRRRRVGEGFLVCVAAVALVLGNASAAAASVTATWGWTTDSLTMSFFGGIPYRGCEKARLTVPNSGSTGTVAATTWSTIVVGLGSCSDGSVPGSLNPNTIRTRTQVTRNGYLEAGCATSTTYNSAGEGVVAVTGACTKSSSADATWRVLGTYGWWDYDDTTWRGESVNNPVLVD